MFIKNLKEFNKLLIDFNKKNIKKDKNINFVIDSINKIIECDFKKFNISFDKLVYFFELYTIEKDNIYIKEILKTLFNDIFINYFNFSDFLYEDNNINFDKFKYLGVNNIISSGSFSKIIYGFSNDNCNKQIIYKIKPLTTMFANFKNYYIDYKIGTLISAKCSFYNKESFFYDYFLSLDAKDFFKFIKDDTFLVFEELHRYSGVNLLTYIHSFNDDKEYNLQRLKLSLSLCEKIYYLHSEGFSHGDLKDSNVLVDMNEVFLCDFDSVIKDKEEVITPIFTAEYISDNFIENYIYNNKPINIPYEEIKKNDNYGLRAILSGCDFYFLKRFYGDDKGSCIKKYNKSFKKVKFIKKGLIPDCIQNKFGTKLQEIFNKNTRNETNYTSLDMLIAVKCILLGNYDNDFIEISLKQKERFLQNL